MSALMEENARLRAELEEMRLLLAGRPAAEKMQRVKYICGEGREEEIEREEGHDRRRDRRRRLFPF